MLLVKRNKPNLFRIENVTFVPGITELKNKEDIELVRKHKTYNELLKSGVMTELSEKPIDEVGEQGNDLTGDIAEMHAKVAVPIIQETFSVVTLEDMYTREQGKRGRKSVLNAIKDQITEMRTSISEKDKTSKE